MGARDELLESALTWLLDEANHILVALLSIIATLLVIRLTSCLPAYGSRRKRHPQGRDRSGQKTVKTMVYFGSGGHTTEMIRLVQGLDVQKYQPLIFAIGHTDVTSQSKVRAANLALEPGARWLRVYRNREVKQSWFTTVFTTLWSLIQALYVMCRNRPQLLLVNGPGTTVSLCYCAFLLRVLGLTDTTIVFVESFCRTREASLTARLVYPVSDRFIVPWPDLLEKFPRAEYLGHIM
jgi:beta-1,4-N-acetylglucosaminyltransferase